MNHLVITGGSGGLGRAVIDAFTCPEWNIAAPSHSELDATDSVAIRGFFESRSVDLLVCAAGLTRDALLSRTDESTWDEVLAVNFQGAADSANAVLPRMIERGTGHIVFISSQSAIHPPTGQAAYATAKASLLGLTRSLARRHGAHGIRVNVILPGFLETGMTQTVSEKRKAEILGSHHLGRFNTPAAVAGFIRFLHHGLPHTSGQVFQLDSRCQE
ncbi:MAG: SDR family NAD(P)-dependent oxidoreductase [Verrucomicrobiota bacterium]